MMRPWLVAAALTATIVSGSAWADAASTMGTLGVHATGGAEVYRHVCQGCHMPDGKGAIGAAAFPAFAGNKKLAGGVYPIYVVLNGHGGMPWFNGVLTDTQIADVVSYIRGSFGNHYPPVTAATVAALRGPAPVAER